MVYLALHSMNRINASFSEPFILLLNVKIINLLILFYLFTEILLLKGFFSMLQFNIR